MCGQVLSFPIMVGTAISLGTIVTYKISPNGNLHWLIAGTSVALLAVVAGAISSWERARHHIVGIASDIEKRKSTNSDELQQQQQELDHQTSLHRSLLVRGIVLSLLAGIVFSGWIALSVLAQQGSGCTPPGNRNCPTFEGLSPYGALFWYSISFNKLFAIFLLASCSLSPFLSLLLPLHLIASSSSCSSCYFFLLLLASLCFLKKISFFLFFFLLLHLFFFFLLSSTSGSLPVPFILPLIALLQVHHRKHLLGLPWCSSALTPTDQSNYRACESDLRVPASE